MGLLEILQVAIPVGGCSASVDEDVGTADETASTRHEELCKVANLIGCACAAGWRRLNHAQITVFARTMQFANGVMMMPGEMLLIVAPLLPQRAASNITRSTLHRLEY